MGLIWCFSHCLEFVLKEDLKTYTSPVGESLMHLFHLYKNSSKKHRKLKKAISVNERSIWNLRSTKAGRTRWIDHKICAMERAVNKYGLYCQHLQYEITDKNNQKTELHQKGKFNKLVDAKILLPSCFFIDVLRPAKIFSWHCWHFHRHCWLCGYYKAKLQKTLKTIWKWQK